MSDLSQQLARMKAIRIAAERAQETRRVFNPEWSEEATAIAAALPEDAKDGYWAGSWEYFNSWEDSEDRMGAPRMIDNKHQPERSFAGDDAWLIGWLHGRIGMIQELMAARDEAIFRVNELRHV